MKRIILFVIFFGIWLYTFSQEDDKLVVGNDTTSCQLKIDRKKGEIIVLYKKAYHSTWNEIYATNADAAIVSDRSLFLSLKLPSIPEKVWVECLFWGTYKLYSYQGKYYISCNDGIAELQNQIHGKSSVSKSFIGQMIYILKDRIDYDFNSLRYDSKSLVLPLIKFHEVNGLPYRDYNHYLEICSDWNIRGGFSQEIFNLSNQSVSSVEIIGYSPFTAIDFSFYFPELSKRLFFITGIEFSIPEFDVLKTKSLFDRTYYFDVSYSGLNLAIPIMAGFRLIQNPNLHISAATGLKAMKGFSFNQNLRIETETENIVETDLATMSTISKIDFFHYSELIVGMPELSKSFSFGASYNSLLSNKVQKNNTVCLNRSLSLFIRFTF